MKAAWENPAWPFCRKWAVLSHFDDGVWFVPLAETLPDVAAEAASPQPLVAQ
ncbi:MAG: hypothetical protein U0175_37665 [Caldilineaceae bacterium]